MVPPPDVLVGREAALRDLKGRLGLSETSAYHVDGRKLARLRQERRFTQAQLSKACRPSVSVNRIQDIEQGRAESLRVQTVEALANALAAPVGDLLRDAAVRRLTVMRGWPGVGKTTLAAALIHDPSVAALFPDGVLWCSLNPSSEPLHELRRWARSVGADDLERETDLRDARNRLASILQDRRMLLVIDDAWAVEQVQPLLAGGRQCATLVTTRISLVAHALALPEDVYRLEPLDSEASLELLAKLAPRVAREHGEECRRLIQKIEGSPLALQVLGRRLQMESRRGEDVVRLLEEYRSLARLLELPAPPNVRDLANPTPPTVAALLRHSANALSPEARPRFATLGLVDENPASFDLSFFKAQWQVDDPRPTIDALVDQGLLESSGAGRFQMHALVVALARSLLAATPVAVPSEL